MSKEIAGFDPAEFEYTTRSGRIFKMRELNARQQMEADSISDKLQSTIYNRLAMSLVQVDDAELRPARTKLEIDSRLDCLRGSEADELVMAYVKHFNPSGDELKNESAPAD